MSEGGSGTFDRAELERLFREELRRARVGAWREAAWNAASIARSAGLDEPTGRFLSEAFEAYAASLEAGLAAPRPRGRWSAWIEKYLPGLGRERKRGSA